jgi:hypothetical protein
MMDTTLERQEMLETNIKELASINKKIAKLTVLKEELTAQIIEGFEHNHEGQKSYELGVWKVECKTPMIYSLDKKAYAIDKEKLPEGLNPVKESVSYTVDKKLCEAYIATAPKKVKKLLSDLISKKPGKASVTIKDKS